ncbi:DUF4381 domain-containing protein [Rahnella bruchi]|uniref:DUF4381 family protein n=1 Tax=Rahnella bruchi TaxID=1510573 RepID=UPI000EA30F20|nr:DUF4381 family protein [Rahnella bruchi]
MLEKGFSVPDLFQPALPGRFSWFPLPPGWYVLAALLAAILLIFLFYRLARWRRNLWRRQALAALRQPQDADGWLELIKRILLMHQPRDVVSQWLTPEQLLQQVAIDADLRQQLSDRYCQPDNALDAKQNARLQSQLTHWLEKLPDV